MAGEGLKPNEHKLTLARFMCEDPCADSESFVRGRPTLTTFFKVFFDILSDLNGVSLAGR